MDELAVNGVKEGRKDFALKQQLITAERRTDLRFDGNDKIGSSNWESKHRRLISAEREWDGESS